MRKTTVESASKQSESFPESLVWAIASVFIVGIGSIIGLMAVMKQALHFDNSVILAVTLLSFLLLFVIEGAFIWLLFSRRKSSTKERDEAERTEEQTTRELDAAQARVLPEHMPSVTEQTTRTFEPIYRERGLSKE